MNPARSLAPAIVGGSLGGRVDLCAGAAGAAPGVLGHRFSTV